MAIEEPARVDSGVMIMVDVHNTLCIAVMKIRHSDNQTKVAAEIGGGHCGYARLSSLLSMALVPDISYGRRKHAQAGAVALDVCEDANAIVVEVDITGA